MRKRLPVLVILSIITFLIACQKQLSDPSINGPDPVEDVKHLVKFTSWYPLHSYVDSFAYDDQNRCTRMYEIVIDSSSGTRDPYVYFYDFHYNGSETVPYLITDTALGRDMNWYVMYDSQKRKLMDSITYVSVPGSYEVVHFNYAPGRIVASTVSPGSIFDVRRDTFFMNGNNCTKYYSFGNSPSYQYWLQDVNTYDNGINPINKLNIGTTMFFGSNGTIGTYIGLNQNNIVSSISTNDAGVSFVENVQHVYGSDGWLLSSYYSYVGRPDLNETVTFTYNK